MESAPGIVIVDRRIDPSELARLVHLFFGDMVKYVVDLERRVAAVGGELHADAEQLLLESGSLVKGEMPASSIRRSSTSVPHRETGAC